jgi:hypothetical protein
MAGPGHDGDAPGRRRPGVGSWVVLWVALTALMAAWSLSGPLYSGPDEPSQVIRAVSLVQGQLLGRQDLGPQSPFVTVTVPAWLATANDAPSCFAQHPSVAAGCEVSPGDPAGSVATTTYTGRYPPLYYWLVGWPCLFASSSSAFYLMRVASAGLCAVFLAGAFWWALRSRRRAGLLAGLALAATPQVIYFGTVVNPSGLELSAALCLWVAGLEVVAGAPRPNRAALAWVVVSGAALANTPGLSPALLMVILAVLMALAGRASLTLLRTRAGLAGTAVLVASGIVAVVWYFYANSAVVKASTEAMPTGTFARAGTSVLDVIEVIPQYVGSFGWQDVELPVAVVVVALAVGVPLLVGAAFRAERRLRWILIGFALLCGLIPTAISWVEAAHLGQFGQARYWMPLWLGLPLVALGAPGAHDLRLGRGAPALAGGAAVLQAFSWWWALERYRVGIGHSWLAPDQWSPPVPAFVLAAVVVASLATVGWQCWRPSADAGR